LALQRHDLDLDGGLLRVERSMSRHEGVRPLKSRQQGESRTIPLPADVVTRLRQHPVPLLLDGWLFPTSTGNARSDSNWRKRTWRRIKAASGVECRPHDLRHTVATRLFTVARWTPGEVQRYMGHLDPPGDVSDLHPHHNRGPPRTTRYGCVGRRRLRMIAVESSHTPQSYVPICVVCRLDLPRCPPRCQQGSPAR
jgi:hypothetical protein